MPYDCFFKKYWFSIIFMIVLAACLIFIVPAQEKYYTQDDVKAIERRSLLIAFGLAGLLLLIALIVAIGKYKTAPTLWGLLSMILALASVAFFLFRPLIQTGTLYFNRLKKNETINREYTGPFGNTTSFIVLYDKETKKPVWFNSILDVADTSLIGVNRDVTISFKRGLFGYDHSPKLSAE